MNFFLKRKKNATLFFLNVEVSREGSKFVTTAYHEPTFNGTCTHFDSSLPTTYKFDMICAWLSDVFQFVPTGLTFIMSIFTYF